MAKKITLGVFMKHDDIFDYLGAGTGCLIVLIILSVFPLLALWTDSNLDFWLSYISHKPVDIPYLLSLLITVVLNGVIILANVILSILRYCIGG
jgi:hypothetical protein